MSEVTVQIPATTANLGPGYDCLGVALKIFNRVTVSLEREGRPVIPEPDSMAATAAGSFFAAAKMSAKPFRWSIAGDVPRSRGLGSSVTVRLGILHGLNALCGEPLDREELFHLCAVLEGHPDNAAPATFGGFTVAGGESVARFEVSPELHFVLLIPDFEIATPDARRVLPPQLDRLSAVESCANACRITAAFATKRLDLLRGAFRDGLHQPFREALIPFLPAVIRAGENAGALGGFLSGSGSTVCCVTLDAPERVADAMLAAAVSSAGTSSAGGGERTGTAARIVLTRADNTGTRLV